MLPLLVSFDQSVFVTPTKKSKKKSKKKSSKYNTITRNAYNSKCTYPIIIKTEIQVDSNPSNNFT